MDDFLKYIVSPMLSQPDKLSVKIAGSSATIHVSPEDMGRVIGKHGNIISAVRNLAKVYCATHKVPAMSITLAEG